MAGEHGSSNAFLQLGYIYYNKNDPETAKKYFKKSASLGSNEAKEILDELEKGIMERLEGKKKDISTTAYIY